MRPGRAADHSPPSSATVLEEQNYTSTHPLGHTGSVTGSLYLFFYIYMVNFYTFSTYMSLVEAGPGLLLFIGCAIGAQLYNYKVNRHNTVHMKFHTLLILLYNPFFVKSCH